MSGILLVIGVILLVGLIIWLIMLPGNIVSTKPAQMPEYAPDRLLWTVATVGTGVIPGVIAALLYRYKNVSPGKAFGLGIFAYLAFAWLVVGILWSLGFDV